MVTSNRSWSIAAPDGCAAAGACPVAGATPQNKISAALSPIFTHLPIGMVFPFLRRRRFANSMGLYQNPPPGKPRPAPAPRQTQNDEVAQ
jgi:hypothetical protein